MQASKDRRILSYKEILIVLSKYGFPVARGDIASSIRGAIEIADRICYPIVLKVMSPHIVHKTDADVLRVNVKSESELVEGYKGIMENAKNYNQEAHIDGVLVQEMLPNDVEVIIGLSRDPQFGPVVLFGLGGIFAEVLKDVSLRVPPLTRFDAEEMIKEIRGHKILEGFRGKPKRDSEAIIDVLLRVSKMAVDLKNSILEMDLNPVVVQPEGKGAKIVDARFVVSNLSEHFKR